MFFSGRFSIEFIVHMYHCVVCFRILL